VIATAAALSACSNNGQSLPHETRRVEVGETIGGHTFADPYAWMEETGSEEVRSWVATEDLRARAFLEPAQKEIGEFRARLNSYNAATSYETPVRRGDAFFLMIDGMSHSGPSLYMRVGEVDTPLVMPEQFSEIGLTADAQIADFSVSHDGIRIVVTAQDPAIRRRIARVFSVAEGTFLPDKVEGARLSQSPWLNDDTGFVYSTRERDDRAAGVWLHRLGTDTTTDRQLYRAEPGWETRFRAHVVNDRNDLIVVASDVDGNQTAYWLSEAKEWTKPETAISLPPKSRLFHLGTLQTDVSYFHAVTAGGGETIISSRPGSNGEFILHEVMEVSDLGVSTVHLYGGKLVLNSLNDGTPVIRVHDLEGRSLAVLSPPFGLLWTNFPAGWPAILGEADARYAYVNSLALDAPGIYEVDLGALTLEPWLLKPDTEDRDVLVRRITYESSDGVEVPMALVHRADVAIDGTAPTLVWVYGAHAFVATPYFNSFFSAFIDMGGVFAMPQVRGGGVFGPRWHEAGSRANKLNTVADTISALEWLIDNKVTRPEKLSILGNSAGTVPVAVAAIRHPELVGAMILEVPLADLVRHPDWSEGWNTEFGDPSITEELQALMQFSPYELLQVRRPLPPTMILVGENDPVAPPQHAYKLAASMQHAQTHEDHPILLYLVHGAGHQIGVNKSQRQESQSFQMAFLWRELHLGASDR